MEGGGKSRKGGTKNRDERGKISGTLFGAVGVKEFKTETANLPWGAPGGGGLGWGKFDAKELGCEGNNERKKRPKKKNKNSEQEKESKVNSWLMER